MLLSLVQVVGVGGGTEDSAVLRTLVAADNEAVAAKYRSENSSRHTLAYWLTVFNNLKRLVEAVANTQLTFCAGAVLVHGIMWVKFVNHSRERSTRSGPAHAGRSWSRGCESSG